mgnify:CR=1 FL=1
MKKAVNVLRVLLIVLMLISIGTTICSASGINAAQIAENLKGSETSASGDIQNIGNSIIGIITTVGVVVAVVVLLILGIKYMMGSAQEKAEYKKTMIPYLVGALLIFGASAITMVVVNVASSLSAGNTAS